MIQVSVRKNGKVTPKETLIGCEKVSLGRRFVSEEAKSRCDEGRRILAKEQYDFAISHTEAYFETGLKYNSRLSSNNPVNTLLAMGF